MRSSLFAALLLTAITYTPAYADNTTDADGHNYVNGLCTADHDCDARYVMSKGTAPSQDANYVYQLNSAQDFFYWAVMVRNSTTSFSGKAKLNVDVDLSLLWTNSETPTSWTPIGTTSTSFQGTFDGGGHSIKNLYVNNTSSQRAGLFGQVNNATISNLYVKATTINASTSVLSHGGIIAGSSNGATFTNCYTYATTVTTNCTIFGGIVGYLQSGTMTNCYNLSTIDSQPVYSPGNGSYLQIGGIVGYCYPATLTHCFNQGQISITPQGSSTFTGVRYGGIAANAAISTVFTRCYASGKVVTPTSNLVLSSYGGIFLGSEPTSSKAPTYSECYGLLSSDDANASALIGSSSTAKDGLSKLLPLGYTKTEDAYFYTVFGSSVLCDDEGGIHNEFIKDESDKYIDNVVFYNASDYTKPYLAKNIVLTDGTPYACNTTYTAESFSFTRSITTNNTFSFILPMEILSANVPKDCPLYLLSSVDTENNTLNFERATYIQAHLPYLVVEPAASEFSISVSNVDNKRYSSINPTKAVSNGNVTVTHTGSYLPQSYTADKTNTYYGYKDGKFVKAKKSHLKPFRTMLHYTSSDASTAPLAFNVSIDGETTGIISPELESSTVDVYDLSGRQLRHAVNSVTALSGLPNGIYIVGGQKVVKQ